MDSVRRLQGDDEIAAAKQALYAVFRSFDFDEHMFTDACDAFAILNPSNWIPPTEQYDAIARAAVAVGASDAYCTYVEGIKHKAHDFYPDLTAMLQLQPGQADLVYCVLDGVHWMAAMYAADGTWGLVTIDTFAVIGGSQAFIRALGEQLDLDAMAVSYLQFWLNWSATDIEWALPLAERYLGREQAAIYLKRAQTEPYPYARDR